MALVVASALGLSGCIEGAVREPQAARAPTYSEWTSTYLWGLVGSSEVDVRNYCATGAARVKAGGEILSTALGIVSLGIYLPRVVTVECSTGTERPPSGSQPTTRGGT